MLEFNCRFGDPETQSLLPRLEGDLLDALARRPLGSAPAQLARRARGGDASCSPAATIPARGDSGTPIEGIEDAEATGALVFHAGTALHDGRLVTNGGRILNVDGTRRHDRRRREPPRTTRRRT